ncbi:hypothetical protein CHS0354_021560 [Potamilus streckersoni]|uniref:Uncharacterized protein n=1 Tax=Potamilus streckersoni TaxID=2493646 RepID=A0AAE0VYD9_9BIVA|nr:hypothetical protein CHS0354_021560 [Potamilus streckersoni]
MIFVHVLAVVLVFLKCVQDLGIKHYELRTCLLSKILDSKKLCTPERADPSSSRKQNFTDTYIMIPERKTCYEWKYWKSLRTVQCSDDGMKCCFQNSRVESKGTTLCDHRINEFHKVWDEHGKYYHICYRNCQTYAISLQKFLEECPLNPASSIEVWQVQNASLEIFHIRRLKENGQEIEIRQVDSAELVQYFEEVNIENRETIEICQTHITTSSDSNERVCIVLS